VGLEDEKQLQAPLKSGLHPEVNKARVIEWRQLIQAAANIFGTKSLQKIFS
jgi:hypothetical protein